MRRLSGRASILHTAGFTLVEMVTVMTVMGIMAAIALPRLMEHDAFDQIGALDQLRTSLVYAQRIASTRNRSVCVAVTAASASFKVASAAGLAAACDLPLTYLSDNELADVSAPSGLTFLVTANFRFTPSGGLTNNAGTSVPARTISIRRAGVITSTISVQPDNGYALSSAP